MAKFFLIIFLVEGITPPTWNTNGMPMIAKEIGKTHVALTKDQIKKTIAPLLPGFEADGIRVEVARTTGQEIDVEFHLASISTD